MCQGERNSFLKTTYSDYLICPNCAALMEFVERKFVNKSERTVVRCNYEKCTIFNKLYLVSNPTELNLLAIGE
jgi:hypothetical protein